MGRGSRKRLPLFFAVGRLLSSGVPVRGHLMLGSGALYPYHAHASPEAYHVLSGMAEGSVGGETRRVEPGTTIYHAPYPDHGRVTVTVVSCRGRLDFGLISCRELVPDVDEFEGLFNESLAELVRLAETVAKNS